MPVTETDFVHIGPNPFNVQDVQFHWYYLLAVLL